MKGAYNQSEILVFRESHGTLVDEFHLNSMSAFISRSRTEEGMDLMFTVERASYG